MDITTDEPVIRVLRSDDEAATAKLLQGLTTYTSLSAFAAAAGDPEWCVDFEYVTADTEFRTQSFAALTNTPNSGFSPFFLEQDATSADVSFVLNRINGALPPRRAVMFVNNDGGGSNEVTVSMNINIPVASWRATFATIQDGGPSFPTDGVKLTLVLQTSSTSLSINTIQNGFFGFTVAASDKVNLVRFEGDQNVDGGEAFEIDNVCGNTLPFVASESPSVMPSSPPTESPTRSPVPGPEDECFAQDLFLIGNIICFILDIFSFIF